VSAESWIDVNPDIMGGKPCIRDTRITVDTIMWLAGLGYTVADLLGQYPLLAEKDLAYAKTYHDLMVSAAEGGEKPG